MKRELDFFRNLSHFICIFLSYSRVYLTNLEDFEDFLTSSKLPNFYLYYSLLPLINEIDVNGFIMKIKKTIKEQNSPYHRICASIKAREECLTLFKKSVSNLKENFSIESSETQSLKKTINHYRSLTANVIDEIKKWKDSLNLKE